MNELIDATVNGVPLILVVFILVELCKRLQNKDGQPLLHGNWILLTSFAWGLLIGIIYMWWSIPSLSGKDWIPVIFFGIALGGLASIFFDSLKQLVQNLLSKYNS